MGTHGYGEAPPLPDKDDPGPEPGDDPMEEAVEVVLIDQVDDEGYDTPDVTKAQGGAVALYVAGPIAARVAGIEGDHLFAIIVASAVVSVTWIVADAWLRRGRAAAQ